MHRASVTGFGLLASHHTEREAGNKRVIASLPVLFAYAGCYPMLTAMQAEPRYAAMRLRSIGLPLRAYSSN